MHDNHETTIHDTGLRPPTHTCSKLSDLLRCPFQAARDRLHKWTADFARASPLLVPVLSLGRRATMAAASGAAGAAGLLTARATTPAAGGLALRGMTLSAEWFEAAAMVVVAKDLMDMKVGELKDELEAREEARTGPKPFLRCRLHAAIVRARADDNDDGLA